MVIDDGLEIEMQMIRTELKYWFRIMQANSYHRRSFWCKCYYMIPYDDTFCNMYFKSRVAVPPKCFIFK